MGFLVHFGFFFQNKNIFWFTKRLMIVSGYVQAFETMNNSLNDLEIYHENLSLKRLLIILQLYDNEFKLYIL